MDDFIFGKEENITTNSDNIPQSAFVIVESVKGFMLLYNKYRHVWELTGGLIEHGEAPKECAIRECKEESNQDLSMPSLLFIGVAKYANMNAAIYYSFLSREEPFIENNEIKELKWIKLGSELPDMDPYSIELITLYTSLNKHHPSRTP